MGRRTSTGPSGQRPTEKIRNNCFITRCEVRGAGKGPLAGYDVGLKDNISVAGVEMTCDSDLLKGYVPSHDATVVSRLLEAGATITGKLNMEGMAASGSGELSAFGAVSNPRDPDYLAGGSSNGSAAAVVADLVDVSIGTDQGGSVRWPAAWCGCFGMKPTFGLVPYTGIVGIAHTLDHAGILASIVRDCTKVLQMISGEDSLDPRQRYVPSTDYVESLNQDHEEIIVGKLAEGFGLESSNDHVDTALNNALDTFDRDGITVRDVSVPYHDHGSVIWEAIYTEETTALLQTEGVGLFNKGYYDTQFLERFSAVRRDRRDAFPSSTKQLFLLGEHLSRDECGRYHAKAQNLCLKRSEQYDKELEDIDVLALPTVPKLPAPTPLDLEDEELESINVNTSPFNVTGHPAISVTCGSVDDLPIGMMFVGGKFEDDTVLQIARRFEHAVETAL